MVESKQAPAVGNNVCVVGAGMVGLLAVKNLKEQGLNPTAFTKDDYVGGLWHYSRDKGKTTALAQTSSNTSKQMNAFTDFPMLDEFGMHPPMKDLNMYLEQYAEHFDLYPHIQFSESVIRVKRDDEDRAWLVTTKNTKRGKEHVHQFDRVVLATGILNIKNNIDIKGQEKFQGEIIHSREFKDPSEFKGENVLVVGIGATGADTLVFLKQAGAGKLYSSHRAQYWVLPRTVKGKGFDHTMSRRIGNVVRWVASCSTSLCSWLMGKGLAAAQYQAFPFLKNHAALSAPRQPASILSRVPFFSDHLPNYIRDGHIEDVMGVQEITGPRSVRLTDGKEIEELDAIIMCTGYHYDFSFLEGKGDPSDPAFATDGFRRFKAARFSHTDQKFPRLYRGFISEQYPESLAILGHFIMMKPPFVLYDLVTMALGGIWSGNQRLPTASEMRQDIDKHYDFVVSALSADAMPHLGFRLDSRETYAWLNEAASTGVPERLGSWGWKGWSFWWNNRKLYKLLMDGVDVPAVYRLFDTGRGRKPWKGAQAHIEKTNKEVQALGEKWKQEQKKKPKEA